MEFPDFFATTRHDVFRAVYAATGTRAGAEDAVAEAYARAFAHWATVAAHPNPTAWVLRTALNVQRSLWRRLRREALTGSPPEPAAGEAGSSLLDRQIRAAVQALPRRQREVVALRLLADLSADETAALLGLAPATVHVHLHRALGQLRRHLDPGSSGGGTTTGEVTAEAPAETGGVITFAVADLGLASLVRAVRHAY